MNTTRNALTALAFGIPFCAIAQSHITLYGLVDTAVVYQTNAAPNGSSLTSLQQGGEGFLSGSRLGFKGNEDLGGDLSAGFVLEQGLLADTGALDQQGQGFGRQSYVRLGSRQYGELALGRQYTTANTMLYYVEPLGVGAAPSNAWMVYLTGQRYDNAVTYTGTHGPLTAIAEYAFGEQTGNRKAMSSYSFGIKYATAPVVLAGSVQETRDEESRTARIYLAGLRLPLGRLDLFTSYIYSARDADFDASRGGTDTASITSMSTAATPTRRAAINSVFNSRRRDDFMALGATYALDSPVKLTVNVMHNRTRADGFQGNRTTVYGVADYFLSKRTDVYVALAYDRVRGDWSGLLGNATFNWTGGSGKPLNGLDHQTTVMAGIRHQF